MGFWLCRWYLWLAAHVAAHFQFFFCSLLSPTLATVGYAVIQRCDKLSTAKFVKNNCLWVIQINSTPTSVTNTSDYCDLSACWRLVVLHLPYVLRKVNCSPIKVSLWHFLNGYDVNIPLISSLTSKNQIFNLKQTNVVWYLSWK